MLQVKSFQLTDDKGINELLLNYRLAKGASFFMSEGIICIPFEDGEPENQTQKNLDAKEMINEMRKQQEVIRHSIKVVEKMSEMLKERLVTANADFKSEPNNKNFERIKKETEAQLFENASSIRQNQYEVDRLEMNIKLYQETIK